MMCVVINRGVLSLCKTCLRRGLYLFCVCFWVNYVFLFFVLLAEYFIINLAIEYNFLF